MTIQTKKKIWVGGFWLLPFLVIFLPYQLMQNYIEAHHHSVAFEKDLLLDCFWVYVFSVLLAHIQLFLSLRIMWFKKGTCSQFSYQFHSLRFGITLTFYLLAVISFVLFQYGNFLLLVLILGILYFCFCILANLCNFGHWIYTKIPKKTKEEKEEDIPTHKYKRELERASVKKWISIGLVVGGLLGAGYLFGYDVNLPTATPTTLSQTDIEMFLQGDFTYKQEMETTNVVNSSTFEGIIHYRALVTDPANARVMLDALKNDLLYSKLTTHYTFDAIDAEAVISPCFYTPLVKKWGYGWFDQQGNLYADVFGKEKAQSVPNYRRYFRVILREENAVFDYFIFTNQTNQIAILNAVREFCNAL